jgi:anti-sigma regulatory factor (Ser/Thr protein kinase)
MQCVGEASGSATSLELGFELEDLYAVRRAISEFVGDAGLPTARIEELVIAVNEITTNAVLHGRPPTTLRAWHTEAEVVVQVTDAGDGIRDVMAGQLTPSPTDLGGRGLWLARLLCDAVEVRSGGDGCSVTLRAAA